MRSRARLLPSTTRSARDGRRTRKSTNGRRKSSSHGSTRTCAGCLDGCRMSFPRGSCSLIGILRVAFRADAAFTKPEIYDVLEQRDVDYVIRMPANKSLELEIEDILFRPPGRPSCKPLARYKSFRYQAKSWITPRRIVTKVEHHRGELFPPRRLHRDQHGPPESLGRPVLQQARHGGAMDQGRQAADPLEAAVLPSVPGGRSAPATERTGLQPGQPGADSACRIGSSAGR